MFGKWLLSLVVPLALVGALSACNGSSGAVQPGVVNTSAAGSYRGESGRVVEGGPDEATEVWTFMRARGGHWLVSAIQQT